MPKPPKKFNDHPYPYHHELEMEIVDVNNLGMGIGRVDGWVVMVPFVIIGERVKVRIFRNFANYSSADLVEVLEPSSERTEPGCERFGVCGGGQYQHINYAAQKEMKRGHVRQVMENIGEVFVEVQPTIGTEQIYGYRSKLTPHWQRRDKTQPVGPIGFLKQGTRHSIIDTPHCPIATDAINEALPEARRAVTSPITATEKKVLKQKGGTILLRDVVEGVIRTHDSVVTERVGDTVFQFKAGDFFQNNPFILPKMVDYVREQIGSDGVRYLIDAYCGVGLFAISLGKEFEAVAGVEVSESAVLWAQANAKINKVHNTQFIAGKAEAIFADVTFPCDETAMIIDPPRKGCDQQFLDQLFAFGPKRLVYVSCDPATQARDLKILVESGYKVERIQPFDLFPQTRHIENVATLVRA